MDPKLRSKLLLLISYNFRKIGKLEKSLKYAERSLEIVENLFVK